MQPNWKQHRYVFVCISSKASTQREVPKTTTWLIVNPTCAHAPDNMIEDMCEDDVVVNFLNNQRIEEFQTSTLSIQEY